VALTVLFGYWADRPFPEGLRARGGMILRNGRGWLLRAHRAPARFAFAWPRGIIRRRPTAETVLGALPPLAAIVVVVLGFTWGAGLLRWLGVGPIRSASVIGHLKPWLIPYAVIGAGAIALVLFGRRLKPRHRARLLAGFAAADLLVFAVLGVVAVCPGHAESTSRATAAVQPAAHPIATLGYPGRFAIYDPDLLDSGELSALGPPDDNSMSAVPSVQGYSSIVDGNYASRTGTHQASGEGQDVLAPRAAEDGTLGQLDTSILLTLPQYLATDSQLRDALQPPRWSFAGFDGSFAIFADRSATGPLTVHALGDQSASGASVREVRGAADEPTAATVSSPHGVRIVRSVAAIPGWTATWKPQHGQATALPVQRDGLVQAVNVPPGRGLLSWNYVSPRFPAGLALSLVAVVFLIALLVGATASRPRLQATLGNWHRSGKRGGVDVAIEPVSRSPASPIGR
jgi:hypothetical protein